MSCPDTRDYLIQRHVGYDILRRLLIEEPTPELLNFLREQDIASLFPIISDAQSTDAFAMLQRALAMAIFTCGEPLFEDLHWDFTRLFIGPEAPLAPPWESVYVSKDKLLFQHCTHEVKRIYQSSGLLKNEDEGEAADHIGYELDYLYQQSRNVAENMINGASFNDAKPFLHLQLTFLQQHILAFVDDFCLNIQTHSQTEFYRGIALLLPLFLKLDAQRLSDVIEAAVTQPQQ